MRIAALIVEYNPLHNGHLYQIKEARKLVGPKGAIIAIMSGNFCQRGEVSCLDKASKAKLAVELGVDLVIELPVLSVLASANYFAKGAISLINALNCVDYVVCGIESKEPELLVQIAKLLSELNPDLGANSTISETQATWSKALQELLKSGLSYPRAISNLLCNSPYLELIQAEYNTQLEAPILADKITENLSQANNILALSYLQAKFSLPQPTKTWTFHFLERQTGSNFLPAHKIREILAHNRSNLREIFAKLLPFLPATSLTLLINSAQANHLLTANDLQLLERLYLASLSNLLPTNNATDDFAQRLNNESHNLESYLNPDSDIETLAPVESFEAVEAVNAVEQTSLASKLSHKGQTQANIKRKLLKLLLNLPNYSLEELNHLVSAAHYLRVLAFNSYPGRTLLKIIAKSAICPLIMRFSDFYQKQVYTTSKEDFYKLANADYRASNFYAVLSANPQVLDKNLVLTPIKVKRK